MQSGEFWQETCKRAEQICCQLAEDETRAQLSNNRCRRFDSQALAGELHQPDSRRIAFSLPNAPASHYERICECPPKDRRKLLMLKKQKRDSDYYLGRLQREFPIIHADLVAGRYKSVRDAAIAARLRKAPTPLKTMLAAWGKASAAERAEFLRGIGVAPAAVSSPTTIAPIAIDLRLTPATKSRIEAIMSTRGIKQGQVMSELGFSKLDGSLGGALSQDNKLRPAVISALEAWLSKQP
jgi:hypothetical protein